jgi:CDP-diacylglycerol--glycerol-3-phosphate 3-phosphatidyltransferase
MSDVNPNASNWNLPNFLTTLRIAMVPFFGWALLAQGGEDNSLRVLAFFLFMFAMATDRIDGDIARKRNLITNFGKIADPIADKALTGMAFVALSIIGELWWWVTILVLVREWGITALRFFLLRKGIVVAASQGGKLKTFLQSAALAWLCLPLREFGGGWDLVGEGWWWIAMATMAAAVAITVWTGAQYVVDAVKMRTKPSPTPAA